MSCDKYGDCLSSSVSPVSPFLYGDSFTINVSIWAGQNTTGVSPTSWQYDQSVFSARTTNTQAILTIIANATGTYTITASITFSGPGYNSTISTSQTVTIIPLHLTLATALVNITDVYGNVMRNPDGSFYRNDSFCVEWNATLQPDRTDIRVNVTSLIPPSLQLINYSNGYRGLSGRLCYIVLLNATYETYNLTLVASALNSNALVLAQAASTQPFAVVQYRPFFTYYTYMLYNSNSPSTYQRPFVTLVRYEGNDPGYNFTGDINTDQIVASNDTNERAWINNFTFSIDGWSVEISNPQGAQNFNDYISFVKHSNLSVQMYPLNKTYDSITFSDRVQKYYLQANLTDLTGYIQQGIVYFNVSESAWSKDFAGGNYSLFNSSYLYEPVFYNGYITFRAYAADGSPDPAANVSVTVDNPDPLNLYLFSQVRNVFGNDSTVIDAFKADLYPASNITQPLTPMTTGGGSYGFDINQTNMAFPGDAMPYLTITASEGSTSYSYTEPDPFSLFLINDTYFTTSPFSNLTDLYIEPAMIVQPMNFSFGGQMPYVVWGYNSAQPFFPPDLEPGNLSTQMPYIYGQHLVVDVNLQGGGAKVVSLANGSDVYQATVLVTPQSGGATELWVRDSSGRMLAQVALPYNTTPPQPPGFMGLYSISFTPSTNGTVSVGLTNSWGISSTIGSIQVGTAVPAPFVIPQLLVWLFALLVILFFFLGLAAKRRRTA